MPDYGDVDRDAVAVAVSDPEQLHPGERHQHRAGIVPGAAVAVPLDLPAVAVVVGDPEQLHPGERHRHRAGTFPGAAVAVPPIFPPWPWSSVIRSGSTQGTGSKTTMEQTVEQSPCR